MPGAQKISATFPLSKLEQVERIALATCFSLRRGAGWA